MGWMETTLVNQTLPRLQARSTQSASGKSEGLGIRPDITVLIWFFMHSTSLHSKADQYNDYMYFYTTSFDSLMIMIYTRPRPTPKQNSQQKILALKQPLTPPTSRTSTTSAPAWWGPYGKPP